MHLFHFFLLIIFNLATPYNHILSIYPKINKKLYHSYLISSPKEHTLYILSKRKRKKERSCKKINSYNLSSQKKKKPHIIFLSSEGRRRKKEGNIHI